MRCVNHASVHLQMARGGPPKLPKPYAQYKEEQRQSRSNNSSPRLSHRGDEGPDGQQTEEKLIPLTPPFQRSSFGDSGADLVQEVRSFDSLDSTSTSSSSSSTSHEGDQDPFTRATDRQLPAHHPIPPIPPPRPHRKKPSTIQSDVSSAVPSQVVLNQVAAYEKSVILNSGQSRRHKQSLDFSSSIAQALIDIDPLMADHLQNPAPQHSCTPVVLDLAKLPTPLEPTRSCTPSSGSGRSSTDTPTSTSDQSTSDVGRFGHQQERKRSNAMQTVYRSTAPKEEEASNSCKKDPFEELILLQTNSQWPQKKGSVGQGGPPT